ncbi:hypothetical protein G9C98_001965 [Cotesia typhae]|uniref:Uncharacterized protein n=1 Tax=Cotesia typhae TaxID=2053667 RepID=A0A8J5R3R9_9HYME|nr:hypothetical protein G9C98_001965 [Cotesia typhae]
MPISGISRESITYKSYKSATACSQQPDPRDDCTQRTNRVHYRQRRHQNRRNPSDIRRYDQNQ